MQFLIEAIAQIPAKMHEGVPQWLTSAADWATSTAGVACIVALLVGLISGWWIGHHLGYFSGYEEGRNVRRALGARTNGTDDDHAAPREIELETRIWNRPLHGRHPLRLQRPHERKMRVISVFNLKGGVGKTTLTANLAATLARRGRRVLVIDLDHQQSLSGLCLTASQVAETRRSHVAIHHLFDPDETRGDLLHQIAKRVRGVEEHMEVIPSHHELAEKEDVAMLHWLREPNRRDVRFALTAALMNSRFKDWADYIILDCPPRLTTASVNAITTSDFILAPVLPDAVSMDAVQFLVKHLHQLGDLLPGDGLQLRLGLVANRCAPQFEIDRRFWEDVIELCPEEWRQRMVGFNSVIRERVAFRDAAAQAAEAARRFAIDMQKDVALQFSDLADELEAAVHPKVS